LFCPIVLIFLNREFLRLHRLTKTIVGPEKVAANNVSHRWLIAGDGQLFSAPAPLAERDIETQFMSLKYKDLRPNNSPLR
jgi:hypothetical protein